MASNEGDLLARVATMTYGAVWSLIDCSTNAHRLRLEPVSVGAAVNWDQGRRRGNRHVI